MKELPSILAVIPHYGKVALTRRVHAALQDGALPGQVLVLDNAAPEPYPGALRLESNIFWGGALERALDMARAAGTQYLWFCNNDLEFILPARAPVLFAAMRLARLERALGRPVGIWTPAVTAGLYHPQMLHAPEVQYRTAVCVDGVALLLNLACVDAVGGLDMDGNTRGYGLDLWLSLRAHDAGWPVVVDQQALVRHRCHSTARHMDGFLEQAAKAEHRYLTARLGPRWRELTRERASHWNDNTELQ